MSFIKTLSRVSLIVAASGLVITTAVVIMIYSVEAPITEGNIAYNVSYSTSHSLDIYYPTSEKFDKPPVVVFIHGGAWMAGRKESININRFNGAVNQLRANGYVVISPAYTLASSDKAPFPYCIEDVYDALEWLQINGDSLGFDLNNVGVFGESAGAHIAMMTAYAEPTVVERTSIIPDLKYVVNVYGPNRLEGIYHMELMDKYEDLISQLPDCLHENFDLATFLFGFDPKEDEIKTEQFLRHYSPINYLSENAPPMLLIHGEADVIVPVEQSKELKPKLDSLGIENQMHILPNVNHAFGGASQAQKDSVQNWIATFVMEQTQLPS